MRVLIVGCGYVGLPLGKELARRGHEVFGLHRGALAEVELKAAGITPLRTQAVKVAASGQLMAPRLLTGTPAWVSFTLAKV